MNSSLNLINKQMKNKISLICVVLLSVFFNSCQDVVDVPLDTESPRLVIEASINWHKETTGNIQKIKLTTTTSYYTNVIPTVSGATVYIENSANDVFNFIETPDTGEYICTNFVPVINETYTLTVIHNGQIYNATESLKSVAKINTVTQEEIAGLGNTSLKISAYFDDPAIEANYYLYKYKFINNAIPGYDVTDDTFFQGNTFYSIALQEDTHPGDPVEITHYGISKAYFNYMNVLISAAGSNTGGPFQSVPVKVKGNIKNMTNFNNYPYGYFRLSEVDSVVYTIQ